MVHLASSTLVTDRTQYPCVWRTVITVRLVITTRHHDLPSCPSHIERNGQEDATVAHQLNKNAVLQPLLSSESRNVCVVSKEKRLESAVSRKVLVFLGCTHLMVCKHVPRVVLKQVFSSILARYKHI